MFSLLVREKFPFPLAAGRLSTPVKAYVVLPQVSDKEVLV